MATWNIDTSHSSIDFKVRHMGLSTVKGSFKSFEGQAALEDNVLKAFQATIKVASIDTNDDKRDAHLRSADFFDAETYPTMTIKSTSVNRRGNGSYQVTADVTIKDQTHPVTFDVELDTPITDPWGMTRAAANVKGSLDRTKWGLTWNQVLEAGRLLVGNEVKFDFDVQATLS
jgi:polyisoprenoid-binding protein YceI